MSKNSSLAILQAGFMKSGNFWLWNIIESVLTQARVPKKSFIRRQPIYRICKNWDLAFENEGRIDAINLMRRTPFYVIPPVFSWPIDDFDAYVRKCTHVWTHSDPKSYRERFFRSFKKIVYIVRDPRDVSLSIQRFDGNSFRQKFYGTQPEQPPALPMGWNENVGSFLEARGKLPIHFVFYERLLFSWDSELERLLEFLGLDLGTRQKKAVEKSTRFGEMKKKSAAHLARGEAYGWARDLDPDRQRAFTQFHYPLLQHLGYPTDAKDAGQDALPCLPPEEETIRFLSQADREIALGLDTSSLVADLARLTKGKPA